MAIIVEEAGQVLEAHTLASLVDSVEHLVLVGDHLQLRPPISNYGRRLWNFHDSKLIINAQRCRWRTPKAKSTVWTAPSLNDSRRSDSQSRH